MRRGRNPVPLPEHFGSIEDAHSHCQTFVAWYNNQHRHSGIAMLTPEPIHHGEADSIIQVRAATLKAAFDASKPPARRAEIMLVGHK